MDRQQLMAYLEQKPEALLEYPFGPGAHVFKVRKKLFAIVGDAVTVGYPGLASVNLKCDPNEAQMLRDVFDAVLPGYHMNKTHWNTVVLNGSVPEPELKRMIDRSYGLVFKKLPKADREYLLLRYSEDKLLC